MRSLFDFFWIWIFSSTKLFRHSHFMWEKIGWFNWFWQFLCEGLSSFNPKDSITHRHDLAVHVKEELFSRDLSLENSVGSYLCFWLALLHLGSYFFPLYQWPSLSLCMVFYAISSNIDEVLSINLSAYSFVFGDFNIRTG